MFKRKTAYTFSHIALGALAMRHHGKDYGYVVGSDLVRDGMYIEVSDDAEGTQTVIEVFYSDVTHRMCVTLYKPDVPLEVVEWAIAIARERLPVKTIPTD